MSVYTIFATIGVKPEHFSEACAAVEAIVERTCAEPGCIDFRPHRAVDGSSTILIYEAWRGREGFDAHHATDYTRDVFARYENWLAKEPLLVEVKPLGSS